jgi:predicted metal-dependent hydrolase
MSIILIQTEAVFWAVFEDHDAVFWRRVAKTAKGQKRARRLCGRSLVYETVLAVESRRLKSHSSAGIWVRGISDRASDAETQRAESKEAAERLSKLKEQHRSVRNHSNHNTATQQTQQVWARRTSATATTS